MAAGRQYSMLVAESNPLTRLEISSRPSVPAARHNWPSIFSNSHCHHHSALALHCKYGISKKRRTAYARFLDERFPCVLFFPAAD